MTKARVNLSIADEVAGEARALGLNMSALAEDAIAAAVKAERNRRWRAENRAALEAYDAQVAAEGPALARYRRF